jgi:hypothetical protein
MTLSVEVGVYAEETAHAPHQEILRQEAARRLAPLRTLETGLAHRWRVLLDAQELRERARVRLGPYSPREVIEAAGDLGSPFTEATEALERAGLASNREAARARRSAHRASELVAAWASGDTLTAAGAGWAARRAAVLVGRSLLRHASAAVCDALPRSATDRTSCPCCGGVADFAYVTRGRRTLFCGRCDARWDTSVHGCLGCGASSPPALARIAAPGMGCTVLVCSSCGRYLKEREGIAPAAADLLLERALTEALDQAAEARGLRL